MHYDNVAFFGMHFFWWFFWIILWVGFFSMLTPVPRKHWQRMRETPIDILNRRLASGEINEQEYESRKSIIQRNKRAESGEETSNEPKQTKERSQTGVLTPINKGT